MIWYLSLVLLILNAGCVENRPDTSYYPSPASILVNEIQKKVFWQLKKKKKLYPCEFGGGAKTPIRLLHCGFLYYNEIDIETARELIITAGNQFIAEVNANERIRPYLESYLLNQKIF